MEANSLYCLILILFAVNLKNEVDLKRNMVDARLTFHSDSFFQPCGKDKANQKSESRNSEK